MDNVAKLEPSDGWLIHIHFSTQRAYLTQQDVRWKQRLQNFKIAFHDLTEAVELANTRELSKLKQQGLIQSFE